ncbi:Putative prophage CPS-53 integrase [Citrobacter werkmanii]|uniref:Prophage CPS-53 integrase n=1 Tax=Citrobacter werkmanii TaxID=67827 RepID=A0A9N8CMJ5_9ENTR|nr:Putative prophage CPS-53 integrase [Citrobacter werkmanii]CAB5527936.1 Putative prophage CPS-53 integrase [Citrobacter werkmanii]CAB5537068.1 Putative prophage CPS-53 integrase [Citrobacter werkmanii]CAB5556061.1 Putative prophage CPS-53 integrase [Citrobacter werkmanii]CAB5594109.1 Putative prophage CPS-53 integrase [Citrobacter werkmanii]
MRRAHLVPLSTKALDLHNELKIISGNYRYVFPGRNDPNKPMSEASINQVIKRIGYGGKVTWHGFRHSLSMILHEKDYYSSWIEIQLAHVDKNSIRWTYNHALYLDSRMGMMQWHSDKLLSNEINY